MQPKERAEIDSEMREELATKHVEAMFEQKRRTKFDGEVIVKYEFRSGLLYRVHIDNHDVF